MRIASQIGKKNRYDWVAISSFFSLVIIGWLMLYSIKYDPDHPYLFFDPATSIGKQTIWLGISMVVFIMVMNIEWTFWNTLAIPIYTISIVLLILVLIFGTEIKGAKSWFAFGGVSFQPSEIAKFGTALAMASYLSFKKHTFADIKVVATSVGLFLLPMLLILLQPDAGSAVVLLSFFLLLYRKGFSRMFYFLSFSLISIFILSLIAGTSFVLVLVLFIALGVLLFNYTTNINTLIIFGLSLMFSFIFSNRNFSTGVWMVPLLGVLILMLLNFKEGNVRLISIVSLFVVATLTISYATQYAFNNYLKPHQQDRINAWLLPEKCDPNGSLYNVLQSKMVISSGGLTGKGFLNGEMTKLRYVPEQSTDFIFSVIGEEQGFLGTLGVILLYTILVTRLIVMAERAKLEFIRNYIYGVAGILFVHYVINIGMTMGIMPVIGIPLPLISKGGSSLVAFSVMIGVAIKMDSYRIR